MNNEENLMDSIDKLVEIVEPGSQNLIVMTGKGSKLRTVFNPPLEYNLSSVGYEMSLIRLETYFSFPNITENKNNAVNITINDKLYEIRIPTGCYDIESINTVLQKQLFSKGGQKEKTEQYVILSANNNTLKCVLEIKDKKVVVDFGVDNSLRTVLGFEAKKYSNVGSYESENIVNILNVNSILIHCDIIEGSRVNGKIAPVIYSFFPDVSPGEKIVAEPKHLIYIPLTIGIIPSMTSWVTDQTGADIDLRGEELTLTFHVRKKKH